MIEAIEAAADQLQDRLRQLQTNEGFWKGALSTSALSTATAISALCVYRKHAERSILKPGRIDELIDQGMAWIARAQNLDGGFGDTERSHSNIATTYLVMAAIHLADQRNEAPFCEILHRADRYVAEQGSWDGLRKRYGKDKTFVVPILTNCALAGLVDWSQIPPLPFEAASLPQSWYRFAKMPVVSYAIPALVAMGQAKLHFSPPWNPLVRWIRQACIGRTLRVLRTMQPASGGYLEAVPLTSFVLMSLASMKRCDLEVAQEAVRFIDHSVLEDGSWPIDTNLATWVTSLATRAVCQHGSNSTLAPIVRQDTVHWLLGCQHRARHPFTGADPGGWGWTNLSGAVPDADDTPAALLALKAWSQATSITSTDAVAHDICRQLPEAVRMGVDWMLGLQNRDGGWPTFCRGWGQLPFDRSGSDLTAHAMRALIVWREDQEVVGQRARVDRALFRGMKYLLAQQRHDGSWLPLWFGNQDNVEDENPIYGTSRVLMGLVAIDRANLAALGLAAERSQAMKRAADYLIANINSDGGWGGGKSLNYPRELEKLGKTPKESPSSAFLSQDVSKLNFRTPEIPVAGGGIGMSSIEETALAIEALMAYDTQRTFSGFIMRGIEYLLRAVKEGWIDVSWPIGFYFAKLWYHEQLYPVVYSLAALNAAREYTSRSHSN